MVCVLFGWLLASWLFSSSSFVVFVAVLLFFSALF